MHRAFPVKTVKIQEKLEQIFRNDTDDLSLNKNTFRSLFNQNIISLFFACFRFIIECIVQMFYFRTSYHKPFKKKTIRSNILLVGQPRSGKTSILYRLKLNDFILTKPTLRPLNESLNLLTTTGETRSYSVMDLGRYYQTNTDSSEKKLKISNDDEASALLQNTSKQTVQIRKSIFAPWLNDYLNCLAGAIYVIDGSSTLKSIQACKEDIEELLFQDQLTIRECRLAILINKRDIYDTYVQINLGDILELPLSLYNKRWRIFECSAKSGQGLIEAVSWLLFTAFEDFSAVSSTPSEVYLEMATYTK